MQPDSMTGGETSPELCPSFSKPSVVHQYQIEPGLMSAGSQERTNQDMRFNKL